MIGGPVPVAVPVDEIAMYHLALRLECADLHATLNVPRRHGSPDVLEAIFFDQNTILIDESLDPEAHPLQLGRYRYSVGHEIAHWWLHRSAVLKHQARKGRPAVVCREGEGQWSPIEWQAESFSSLLLRPRDRVQEAWGEKPPFAFDVHEHGSPDLRRLWLSLNPDPEIARATFASECEQMFDQFSEPLAQVFQVSNQAMRIRMEGIGLLRRGWGGWPARLAA
jgi:IrrE N-terminal-like domain